MSSAAWRSSPPQSYQSASMALSLQLQGMEEPARAAVLRLGALARLELAHVLSYVAILAQWPAQKASLCTMD